jgi:hypothetical protein
MGLVTRAFRASPLSTIPNMVKPRALLCSCQLAAITDALSQRTCALGCGFPRLRAGRRTQAFSRDHPCRLAFHFRMCSHGPHGFRAGCRRMWRHLIRTERAHLRGRTCAALCASMSFSAHYPIQLLSLLLPVFEPEDATACRRETSACMTVRVSHMITGHPVTAGASMTSSAGARSGDPVAVRIRRGVAHYNAEALRVMTLCSSRCNSKHACLACHGK